MLRQIVIEAETPGDSRTMFRLRINSSLIADGLTAVQAHVLVGEILERVALPKSSNQWHPPMDSLVAQRSPAADSWTPPLGRLAKHREAPRGI